MKKKLLFILPLLSLIFFVGHAQTKHQQVCVSGEAIDNIYKKKYPQAKIKAENFEKRLRNNRKRGVRKKNQKYVIPVVFHVFGTQFRSQWEEYVNNERKYVYNEVPEELVKKALDAVNKNYTVKDNNLHAAFSNIAGTLDIEFKLAKIDPKGNTTNGIIYHEVKNHFGHLGTSDEEVQKYAWDNLKYINIYIQDEVQKNNPGLVGFANLPYIKEYAEDGLLRVAYRGSNLEPEGVFVLTHEIGHYLGLYHTFNEGCVSNPEKGDQVADTPPYTSDSSCDLNRKNCFDDIINVENHMGYCFWVDNHMFTKGQMDRIIGFLDEDEVLKNLWKEEVIIATGVNQETQPRVLFNYQGHLDDYSYKTLNLEESTSNDGSIRNKRKIKAVNGAKFKMQGVLEEGLHYTTNNIPDGLEVKIEVLSDIFADISLEGKANKHSTEDSVDIEITLLDSALANSISSFFSKKGTYKINFVKSASLSTNDIHEESNNIKVYPNPFKEAFNIDIIDSEAFTIEVYDVLGKKVYTKDYDNNNSVVTISKKNFNLNGHYFGKVITPTETTMFKIIKE